MKVSYFNWTTFHFKFYLIFSLFFSISYCDLIENSSFSNECKCKYINLDNEKDPVQARIINSFNIPKKGFEYVVSFEKFGEEKYSYCGGLMINSLHVVTTAYCMNIIKNEIRKYRACIGEPKLSQRVYNSKCKTILNYEIFNKLAFISLKGSPLNKNEKISFACFNHNATIFTSNPETKYYAFGSGFIKKNLDTPIHDEAKISPSIAFRRFEKSDDFCSNGDKEIECITNVGSAICYGDSGYPVLANYKNKNIVSLGLLLELEKDNRACDKGSVHGFIKFDNYINWLYKKSNSELCRYISSKE